MNRNTFKLGLVLTVMLAACTSCDNVVWKKNFGGNDSDTYYSVTAVSDGIIAVGASSHNSFNNGDWNSVAEKGRGDAIIVKYDSSGNIVW